MGLRLALNCERLDPLNKKRTRAEMKDQRKERSRWKSVHIRQVQGSPGGAVVESLPANAGGHGFEPWSGKFPHAVEQLGP